MSIGDRIREERERLGLNQVDFGEIGKVGRKSQFNYESGERYPDALYLADIFEAGVDIQYVVTGLRSETVLSPDEKELLALFRNAPLVVKAAAIGALHGGGSSVMGVNSNVISGSGNHISSGDMIVNPGKARR